MTMVIFHEKQNFVFSGYLLDKTVSANMDFEGVYELVSMESYGGYADLAVRIHGKEWAFCIFHLFLIPDETFEVVP
jgi:hypothetical protein